MIYHSKPHTIQAFRFNDLKLKPPKWFLEANETNKVSVTLRGDEKYITIYSHGGNIERVQWGEWVCMNEQGKMFKITDEEFKGAYS